MRFLAAGLAVVLVLGAAPSVEARQASEHLVRAERLVDEGRFAEARGVLEEWWNERGDGASRADVQKAVWLRALLTVDPDVADLDYRRLVVEFPGGVHSDEALLRLSRGAEARGDRAAARRYLTILIRDYPGSPHRVEARSLLDRLPEGDARAVRGQAPSAGTAREVRGVPDPGPGRQRTQPAPPPTAREHEPNREEPPGAADLAPFSIQLGAFSTEDRARTLAARAGDAGLNVRVVRVEGSEFLRVRLGAFSSREAARERAGEVLALGFEAVVASDREREREVP